MSLINKIKEDQLQARKGRRQEEASLLTTLMSEALMVAKNDGRELPSDDEVIATLRKFIKNNAEVKQHAQSHDLLNATIYEHELLIRYLPKQMTREGIELAIRNAMFEGADTMGALMAYMKANHPGLYDGKVTSEVCKQELA
jgi:uncharacterized protein YqeY